MKTLKTLKTTWTGIRPLVMHNGLMADPTNDYTRRIKAITSKGAKKLTDTYSAEYFEKWLRVKRDTLKFGIDVSNIRTKLLEHGFYLSGRGGKGEQYVILEAAANSQVMENFQFAAATALRKGVILGTNTRVDILTDEERRKHESMLEKLAIRAALFGRRMPALRKALTSITPKQKQLTHDHPAA